MKSDFIFSVLRPVSLRRQTTKNFNYEKVILAKFLVITVFLQHFWFSPFSIKPAIRFGLSYFIFIESFLVLDKKELINKIEARKKRHF